MSQNEGGRKEQASHKVKNIDGKTEQHNFTEVEHTSHLEDLPWKQQDLNYKAVG